ncbi:hypothetical protein Jolie2_37 [Mycobacterium phage Jolie2]|uniref:DNA-binding phage zinc finger domain-containing protein n=1 Tax=Mycobacterium phage Jolie2 TaxID=1458831 RepID=W8ED14_9CAUD|nr:hypothetical protein Jolie2_37 [Mycobacterium phage Jolie2]AHJ86587.1 hypothetical protein Jolie2_37 [Mycobacterium phage Jolie2]
MMYGNGKRKGARLANPRDPMVREALTRKCPDCAAEPEFWCVGIAENSRTKGRRLTRLHFARARFIDSDAPVKAGAR